MRASWGKPRAAAPSIKIRPERYLIVTEGTKTEPYYFESFRKRINAGYHGEYVTLRVCGMGDNTVSLMRGQGRSLLLIPMGSRRSGSSMTRTASLPATSTPLRNAAHPQVTKARYTAQRGPTRPSSCGTYSTSPTSIPRWTEVLTNPSSRVTYAPRVSAGTKRTERTCLISSKAACVWLSRMRRGSRSSIGALLLQTRIRARRSICLSRSCCPT